MSHEPLIAVVEDDSRMASFFRTLLSSHHYRVVIASTSVEAIAMVTSFVPEVVLLDLGLPDGDGIAVLRRVREWSSIAVIVVSARTSEEEKVRALDAGADDYLTKPFGAQELLARIRVALRQRKGQVDVPVLRIHELEINLGLRQVQLRGVEVHLTPLEFKILGLLTRHVGKVLTHQQILQEVWGINAESKFHYVRVHVAQLRRKIELDCARPRYLLTEAGVGYRLRAPERD
jgi:two-component system KDP operon response regulator KdpE